MSDEDEPRDNPTSQTQPEISKLVTDIFGDSDEDSDDEKEKDSKWSRINAAVPEPPVSSTSSNNKGMASSHDIFASDDDTSSDDDSTQRKNKSSKLSRLNKGSSSNRTAKGKENPKKRKKQLSKDEIKRNKKIKILESRKDAFRESSSSSHKLDDDSGDSYASESEPERTMEGNLNFICFYYLIFFGYLFIY